MKGLNMSNGRPTPERHPAADRGKVLSTLWIFLVLSFAYADIFTLSFDKSATAGTTDLSSGAILFFAVVMETAIAAVLLSRILPRVWNRWTNICIAVLQLAVLVYSLAAGAVTSFYVFFAAIEIAVLAFIIGYAWSWRKQRTSAQAVLPQDMAVSVRTR
jgi:hypothetical protein